MNRATRVILAATAAATITGQVQAQDYVLPAPPPLMPGQPVEYAPAASIPMPAPAPVYAGQAYAGHGYAAPGYMPTPGYAPPVQGYPAQPGYAYNYAQPGLPPTASVGYTREERDQWLRDCRAAYEGSGKQGGGILGGVAGAIGGAFLGHHVTDGNATRRLGGTLIGAGVGGLVGLALGAAIGGAFDKKKTDECAAYLARYQGAGYLPGPPDGWGYGWQQGGGYGYGYGYGNYFTVMVPVQVAAGYTYGAPIRTENRYVVEDVVEEVVTVPLTKYVKQAPVTKYIPAAPTKYVKSATKYTK